MIKEPFIKDYLSIRIVTNELVQFGMFVDRFDSKRDAWNFDKSLIKCLTTPAIDVLQD